MSFEYSSFQLIITFGNCKEKEIPLCFSQDFVFRANLKVIPWSQVNYDKELVKMANIMIMAFSLKHHGA